MSFLNSGYTRRTMLRSLVSGSLLLPGIVSGLLADEPAIVPADPLAPKAPHFPPKAKRVIFLYMSGGVSHVDTWDPKPKLMTSHGQKGPNGFFKKPGWEFKARGKCG